MISVLCVGAGGFIGASLRYLMGMIPCSLEFPAITFIINFLGSIMIGMISEASGSMPLSANATLLLKTGLCGGFTTFSTFSLETFNLINRGKKFTAAAYAASSCIACVAGVYIGIMLIKILSGTQD